MTGSLRVFITPGCMDQIYLNKGVLECVFVKFSSLLQGCIYIKRNHAYRFAVTLTMKLQHRASCFETLHCMPGT